MNGLKKLLTFVNIESKKGFHTRLNGGNFPLFY